MLKVGDIIYRLMKRPLALEIREVIGIYHHKHPDRWPNVYIIETIPIIAADVWQSINRVPIYNGIDNLHIVLQETSGCFVSCNEELIVKKYEELLRNA